MKKIVLSLGIILVVIAAVVVTGTYAFFSDTETSTGNTFTAGAIDLKIDNTCHLNGRVCKLNSDTQQYVWYDGTTPSTDTCTCSWTAQDMRGEAILTIDDVKPGDTGESTISLHVDSNPAWVCAEFSNVQQYENDCNSPEFKAETAAYGAGDETCDDEGLGQGELFDNLTLSIWQDNGASTNACNNIKDSDETYLVENKPATDLKFAIADSETGGGAAIQDACVGLVWSLPSTVNNIAQTDSVTADISFKAYQARHNDKFVCYAPDPVCGNGTVESGETCDNNGTNGQVCTADYGGSCNYCTIDCTIETVYGGTCGNGTIELPEVCEGNSTQTCEAAGGYAGQQTCSNCQWSSCVPTESCGDAITNDSETCDEGTALNGTPNHCNSTCSGTTQPSCGNNVTEAGEQCDDGNIMPLDGCSATCTKEPTITIHKDVVNNEVGTKSAAEFQMTIDGSNAAQDTAIYVSSGSHSISEVNSFGYDKTYSTECSDGSVNLVDDQNVTCTVTNTMPYGTITVTKTVTNDDGGLLDVGNFTLRLDGTTVTSGTSKKVTVGTHTASEVGVFGYSAKFSDACNSSGHITVAAGETKNCTITNDDIAPSITVIKNVVNGTAQPDNFNVSIDGNIIPSGSSVSVTSNNAHVIDEEASVSGYTFTSISGTSFKGVSCPDELNGTITLLPGDVVTCTITNTYSGD